MATQMGRAGVGRSWPSSTDDTWEASVFMAHRTSPLGGLSCPSADRGAGKGRRQVRVPDG